MPALLRGAPDDNTRMPPRAWRAAPDVVVCQGFEGRGNGRTRSGLGFLRGGRSHFPFRADDMGGNVKKGVGMLERSPEWDNSKFNDRAAMTFTWCRLGSHSRLYMSHSPLTFYSYCQALKLFTALLRPGLREQLPFPCDKTSAAGWEIYIWCLFLPLY